MVEERTPILLTRGSNVPIWLSTFVGMFIISAFIGGFNFAPFFPPWAVCVALFLQCVGVAVWLNVAISRRTSPLVHIAQRVDPSDVTDELLARLRKLPSAWTACTEIDHVQLAVLELLVHAADARPTLAPGAHARTYGHGGGYKAVTVPQDGFFEAKSGKTPRRGAARAPTPPQRAARAMSPTSWYTADSREDGGADATADGAHTARTNGDDFHSCVGSYDNEVTVPMPAGRPSHSRSTEQRPRSASHEMDEASTRVDNGVLTSINTSSFSGNAADPLGDDALPWPEAMRGAKDPGGPIFFQLMKSLRIGQSLSSVTLPVHILEARSLLEKFSDQFVHAELLTSYDTNEDPYERLLVVVRWWLAAYHIRPDGAKKPYNPVLGEAFCCRFPHGAYLAEQVCHHPPVTAIRASGACFTYQSIYHPQSKLVSPNCAGSIGEGEGWLEVGKNKDRYSLTWPNAFVSGFLAGSARMELGGTVIIASETARVSCAIEFKRKPMFGGHHDQLHAVVRAPDGAKAPYELTGTWHDKIMRRNYDEEPTLFLDAKQLPMPRPTAVDLTDHPLQTRHVWKELTLAIRAGDSAAAAAAKHSIEEHQRGIRKELAAEGKVHSTKYFKFHTGDEALARNAKGHSGSGHGKEIVWTVANWRYVGTSLGVPVA
jgi:hypothetical protein